MKYLIILSVIAAASAISFIDVSREEWTTFKVSITCIYTSYLFESLHSKFLCCSWTSLNSRTTQREQKISRIIVIRPKKLLLLCFCCFDDSHRRYRHKNSTVNGVNRKAFFPLLINSHFTSQKVWLKTNPSFMTHSTDNCFGLDISRSVLISSFFSPLSWHSHLCCLLAQHESPKRRLIEPNRFWLTHLHTAESVSCS